MRRTLRAFLILFVFTLLINNSPSAYSKTAGGLTLVFIFKSDSSLNQPYYLAAFNYYRQQQESNPNITIIRNIESLEETIAVINSQSKPVSQVFLVSHASHWSGLSIPLTSNTQGKTSSTQLLNFLSDKQPQVNTNAYSTNPVITVEGCAIGSNTILLDVLENYYSAKDGTKPDVKAPIGYMLFYYTNNEPALDIQFFKTEVPVLEITLPFATEYTTNDFLEAFSKEYGDTLPWELALELPYSSLMTNAYTHKKRTLTLGSYGHQSDIEKFDSPIEYIKKHKNIRQQLQEYNISADKFKWTFEKTEQKNIIKITGKSLAITVFDSSKVQKAR
ncbi:hypothetical protein [Kangiella sp.]|uniref:hypothetical protein n=1 Tax=Kangiella sp. TaxID=1920245 RepID=UPI003A926C79